MGLEGQENQLELFDVANQPTARLRQESIGRFLLQVRYDQAVLASIAALIGVAVVFACGVERGKQLVRGERALVAHPQLAGSHESGSKGVAPESTVGGKPSATGAETRKASELLETPAIERKPQKPQLTRVAEAPQRGSPVSRYAIQVVAYNQPQLAKRELDRLQSRGERAFLIMRGGRTLVYVGPFGSKDNASEKLSSLRGRYQDCFLKTL